MERSKQENLGQHDGLLPLQCGTFDKYSALKLGEGPSNLERGLRINKSCFCLFLTEEAL